MEQRQRIITGILTLGTLMGSLDSTIVVLAFPTISKDLHADLLTTLWIILIYLLVVAVSTTQLGRLGDIYGRSRMFNAGFGVFTIGSLFCGLSPGIGWLIGSRAVQALGGALMQANSGAIVADTFPPQMRGAAFGYISLGWTVGAMLGIVLGGIITTFIGWQYIFFINIPIGIVATILGIRYVTDAIRVPSRLDIMGIVLLGCSLTLISYGAVDFAGSGFGTSSIIPAILGIIFLGLFLMYERRISFPILDISKLKSRVLKFSILATFFASLGYISVAFLVIMYLQGIRGALAPRCFAPPDTGIHRREFPGPSHGPVLRPVWSTAYLDPRLCCPRPCLFCLLYPAYRYVPGRGPDRIRDFWRRYGHVLPCQ
jgi:MFS family permease